MDISATNNITQNPPNIDWSKVLDLLMKLQDLENKLLTDPKNAQKYLGEMKNLADQLVQQDTGGYSPTNDPSFHKQLVALQGLITEMQGGGFSPLNEIGIVPDVSQLDDLVMALLKAILI